MEGLSVYPGDNEMRVERRQFKRHSVEGLTITIRPKLRLAERRLYKRYSVEGRAVIRTTYAVGATGYLLDVGVRGMLLSSPVVPAEGTELWVHFSFEHAPKAFITLGQVVRARPGGLAVRFLEEPAGLRRTLNSLGPRAN